MDEDEWMYEIMSERADMDYENAKSYGANEPHVDCSDAFKTSQVFECREDVLRWALSVAHENGFVAVILRSDTNTGSRGRSTFVLIGCEWSDEYKCRKKEFIRRDTGTRKCGCPFKLRCKPVAGGEGWMVKLICGVHNHELAKSLVGHPYAGRLTKAEKTIIVDMTKSMVKPRNILLTLKEHNANSCTTIKQIYNARSTFRSSIRGSDLEMQHLMKLLERDQYIYWHRIKDEDVVRDIFWCHPDSVKLVNACNLVFLIDNTYKTNRYRLPLLDFVGMTPTRMTFFAGFAYVEGERVNNLRDALPGVIVTDRDQALMNAVKLSYVTTDKWMDITDMGHVIASRYNVIVVSLSKQQSMTFFPLRSQPLTNSSLHRIICIGHVYDNHFGEIHCRYEVYLKERCPLPPVSLLWSSNCHPQAKSWPNPYISRMQHYKSFMMFKRDYVDLNDD
ncbi:Protein FAR1-RELATED SEQUENCE 5 [Glycine max]|nr:Protein FAR1-RELATED SEQUENCE 5 [Glycine max]